MSHGLDGAVRDVLAFARKFGHHVEPLPKVPPPAVAVLRFRLIEEEVAELNESITDALMGGSLADVAKEAMDVVYVVLGMLLVYGIDPRPCWDAVAGANLSKSPAKDVGGKTVKGDFYLEPDIAAILARQRPIGEDDTAPAGMIPQCYPPPHAKYSVTRDGITYTATPCYGLHEPWWVVKTMDGEAEPVDMRDRDRWAATPAAAIRGAMAAQAARQGQEATP